jgi:hypothetical protein
MENHEQKSVRQSVAEKIKSGQVKMWPRSRFVLKTVLIVLGLLFIGLLILFLVSFISFSLHSSGLWFLPGFGFQGVGLFLNYLPWLLILAALILIIVLEILAKRFSFVWRRPVIYSLLAIALIVTLGSFIIDRTQLHRGLFIRAREGNLPFGGPIYRSFGMPEFRNFIVGNIAEITENGFRLEEHNDQFLNVIFGPDTQFPSGKDFKVGDVVLIIGERQDDTLTALAVRRIEDGFEMFERRPGLPPVMPPMMQ